MTQLSRYLCSSQHPFDLRCVRALHYFFLFIYNGAFSHIWRELCAKNNINNFSPIIIYREYIVNGMQFFWLFCGLGSQDPFSSLPVRKGSVLQMVCTSALLADILVQVSNARVCEPLYIKETE